MRKRKGNEIKHILFPLFFVVLSTDNEFLKLK